MHHITSIVKKKMFIWNRWFITTQSRWRQDSLVCIKWEEKRMRRYAKWRLASYEKLFLESRSDAFTIKLIYNLHCEWNGVMNYFDHKEELIFLKENDCFEKHQWETLYSVPSSIFFESEKRRRKYTNSNKSI